MPTTQSQSRQGGPHIRNGKPRAGGRLANFIAKQDTSNHPIFEDGLVYVSVEGQHPRKAVLGEADYLRITSKAPGHPGLTRTRWWLDEDSMLRAYSLGEKHMAHGVLVVAAILGAKEGDTLEVPADPLDLRLSGLRRVAG